jgi:hypothetical protein
MSKSAIEVVSAKYTSNGWTLIPQKGSINDLIAHKKSRVHFVQVITDANHEDAKFHGLPKNTFIQNAFSNNALPIHARVSNGPKGTFKVSFEDVNLNTRVIVSERKKVVDKEPAKSTAAKKTKSKVDEKV